MRNEEKPFVCYKGGGLKIVPRNAAGWRALGVWLASYFIATASFLVIATHSPETMAIYMTIGFLIFTLAWIVAMTRWMLARSEVVNLNELLELKRELKARKRGDRK
jgi:hypothetical protein